MNVFRDLKLVACLVLATVLFMGSCISRVEAEETLSFSIIAASADTLIDCMETDAEIDENIIDIALAKILSSGKAIV